MQRLPLAPPPRPDEALSSWIARVAARYDVSPYELTRHVIPAEAGYADMYRLIDSRAAGPLQAALANVTGQSEAEFGVRRLAGLTADPGTAWPRRLWAWCHCASRRTSSISVRCIFAGSGGLAAT